VTLNVGCSQCPEISTMAVGFTGSVAAMPLRKSAMAFQAVGGFHSMKKQGPAPCGTNSVGMVRSVAGSLAIISGLREGRATKHDLHSAVREPAKKNTQF